MTKKFDAIATLGTYTDKATGKKVKRFLTVGTVFESPNGKLFMRLDALPVAADWSGFLSFRSAPETPADEQPAPQPPAP